MNEPGIERKQRTPIKAIRAYCLWCSCESSNEVKLCPKTDCPLHNYRFGRFKGFIDKPRPPKAIRARCVDCVGGSVYEANGCNSSECPLQAYRTGHRPRIGISPSETCAPAEPACCVALTENKTIVKGGADGGE